MLKFEKITAMAQKEREDRGRLEQSVSTESQERKSIREEEKPGLEQKTE